MVRIFLVCGMRTVPPATTLLNITCKELQRHCLALMRIRSRQVQAAARMRAQRRRFLRLRAAAVTLQAAWRGLRARKQLRQAAAATHLQRCVHGAAV